MFLDFFPPQKRQLNLQKSGTPYLVVWIGWGFELVLEGRCSLPLHFTNPAPNHQAELKGPGSGFHSGRQSSTSRTSTAWSTCSLAVAPREVPGIQQHSNPETSEVSFLVALLQNLKALGLPGASIICQGNPSIFQKRTPM